MSNEKSAGKREWVSVQDANKRLKTEAAREVKDRTQCPYLSTIMRHRLDFDIERKCSVTLQTQNVYMCLVCGELFQGRGQKTPACGHALQEEHFMFADCFTGQIWCLPDTYEVVDDSLSDIQHNLNPSYAAEEIEALLRESQRTRQSGDQKKFFRVGYVGLNNVKDTQCLNAVMQALLHIPPLVRHYMRSLTYSKEVKRTPLRDAFADLFKRVWNPHSVFGQVAPRGLVDLLLEQSAVPWKDAATGQPDAQKLLHYLLSALNEAERKAASKKGGKKSGKQVPTVIQETFQGRTRVVRREYDSSREMTSTSANEVPFFTLPLKLPDNPLSQNEEQRNKIPVQHIHELLSRYDGEQERVVAAEDGKSVGQSYQITKLPKYLVIFYDRFSVHRTVRMKHVVRRNPCQVETPVVDLDLSRYVSDSERARYTSCNYDLIANVVHEGEAEGGVFKTRVYHKQLATWFEMEDLNVAEIDKGTEHSSIFVTPAYIQVWEFKGLERTDEERADAATAVD
eukprot:TRINITY_DN18365_c0_g1_i1.p1 TRINITY_DN18365_c0_g1~~TRINITY_DN18365_c0_g1_i1.p1  ORF type:complete len:510 (+),score=195.40 TRINITY_DN18365_c0_g1_i1:53-1582(+)